MSMLVPDDLRAAPPAADDVAHGFEGDRKPELCHIQAVLDRLSPEPTIARNLRWSSVFRISHRIVDAYGRGRVFVAGNPAGPGPQPGGRAPDATGLTRDAVTGPLRLFSLLGRREHTTLLYAGDDATADDVALFERAADAALQAAQARMDVYLVAGPKADVSATVLPLIRDSDGDFAPMYAATASSVFVVRPDGYLGFAATGIDGDHLVAHLRTTFASLASTNAPDTRS